MTTKETGLNQGEGHAKWNTLLKLSPAKQNQYPLRLLRVRTLDYLWPTSPFLKGIQSLMR